jgi:hypothetical protein
MTLPESRRTELLAEYAQVVAILQSYDDYFLKIKNWGVTIGGAALGLALKESSAMTCLLASLLVSGFWATEVHFKMLQLGHTLRAAELEGSLNRDEMPDAAPRIMGAFGDARALNAARRTWKSWAFAPGIMLPHAALVAAGMVAACALAVASWADASVR